MLGGRNLSLVCENGVSKEVVCLPWQLVTAVTVRCVPFVGELCVYRKVLPILLSGHTQELHHLSPGLAALRGQRVLKWSMWSSLVTDQNL